MSASKPSNASGMADLKRESSKTHSTWIELDSAIGVAYSVNSTGAVAEQSVGVVDEHLVALGATSQGTFGLALNYPCEVKVVDGHQRTIAALKFSNFKQSNGDAQRNYFHECAIRLVRSAEDQRLPIQGRIVGASAGRYHVDLGAELVGYIRASPSGTGTKKKSTGNRLRFFEVKKISPNADEIELALWSRRRVVGKVIAQTAYDDIIKALTPAVGTPRDIISALLLRGAEELSRDASSIEVQAASAKMSIFLNSTETTELATVAVSSARAVANKTPDLAIGILQLAEFELAGRLDRARLGFVQIELAKLMRQADRDVSARLYARAGARSALAAGATRIASAALEMLRGWEAPPVRA